MEIISLGKGQQRGVGSSHQEETLGWGGGGIVIQREEEERGGYDMKTKTTSTGARKYKKMGERKEIDKLQVSRRATGVNNPSVTAGHHHD